MALDRQSIEKKDFPVGRRGYEPEAVDAHLSALAGEVAELTRTPASGGGSLASAASSQVQAIVEAAETTAAQILSDAEQQGQQLRGQAEQEGQRQQQPAEAA